MRTIVFTVHEPPNAPADRIERAEQLEFVRDGFSSFAAAIPPLWMAMNRLWLALLIYLLAAMGLSMGLAMLGVDKTLIGLITLAANIIIGFEASSLQRWTLRRRDWSEIGTVVGRNRGECERRFFDGWLDTQPVLRRSPGLPMPVSSVSPRSPKLLVPAAAPVPPQPDDGGHSFDLGRVDANHNLDAQTRPLWRRLLRR